MTDWINLFEIPSLPGFCMASLWEAYASNIFYIGFDRVIDCDSDT